MWRTFVTFERWNNSKSIGVKWFTWRFNKDCNTNVLFFTRIHIRYITSHIHQNPVNITWKTSHWTNRNYLALIVRWKKKVWNSTEIQHWNDSQKLMRTTELDFQRKTEKKYFTQTKRDFFSGERMFLLLGLCHVNLI